MKVIIIYGSANDKDFMKPAHTYFDEQGVKYEDHVISAHRNLPELIKFLRDRRSKLIAYHPRLYLRP